MNGHSDRDVSVLKEIGSWIPQVFYDLIGRVAPGTFLLLVAGSLFSDLQFVADAREFGRSLETIEAVSLWAALSYVLGVVLGGLGYFMPDGHHELFTDVDAITAKIPPSIDSPVSSGGQIAFLYDALNFHNPAAGARLAKLRAEQHMCRVLWVGSVVLVVLHVGVRWRASAEQWPAILGLLVTAIGARRFYLHLEVRSRRLLMNYCQLLTELREQIRDSKDRPTQVTDQRWNATAAQWLWWLTWLSPHRRLTAIQTTNHQPPPTVPTNLHR